MWKELKKDNLEDLAKYADVGLRFFASDMHYEIASNVYLSGQLERKGNNIRFFLLDRGTKKMIYGLKYSDSYPNPYTGKNGMWKIIDLAYLGDWSEKDSNGVSYEALRFGIKSIRAQFDKDNIDNAYIILNTDTERAKTLPDTLAPQASVFLNFLNNVQDTSWEITDKQVLPDGKHYVLHLRRDPKKKPPDEDTWKKT